MSLATLSFQLFNDAAGTQPFVGVKQIVNNVNFTDNPQVFTLYFLSPISGRTLQAVSNPGVDQITVTPVDTTPVWAPNTLYKNASPQAAVEPLVKNGYWYICVTTGTSGATAPVWPTTGIGSTVIDGTCVWQLISRTHPTTEVKLALTNAGLTSATAGAALSLGTTLNGGVANATSIWVSITNSVSTVSDSTQWPQLGLYINAVNEA